jgi:diguanylate cyclase (GGDEF)-like protein
MMNEARAAARPLTIAICDVDHFKEINDLHGHGHGDEVLCRLTALFRSELDSPDHYGRFGGEEFILFFPGIDAETARYRVEALRTKIMAIRIGELPLHLTASFGVAGMTLTDHMLADIIKRADRALYTSKEGGRNRTTIDRQAQPAF